MRFALYPKRNIYMEKIIVDGAHMRCTFATGDAQIRVDSHSLVRIGGALVATEADKAGMKNIPTFGTCKCGWPNRPCVPSPIAWQHVAAQSSVNGAKKLTMQSFCPCAKGGRISFCDAADNSFVESE